MDKYKYGTEENKAFFKEISEELLSFGHRFPSPGGGAYYLGDDGTPWTDRPRHTWITSRMCHVYSLGHFLGHEGSDELIDAALKGLHGELRDNVNGGWYAGVTPDGKMLPDKQCYAHAFVILASCSAVRAERPVAKELLESALQVYDRYFWNEDEGLACDTWDTEFKVCDPYRGLNANMHTVEAFLAVADVCKDAKYRKRAGRIIDHVIGWAGENDWRIPEHFILVPVNDCRRQEFTGTAYTAAKVFKTAVNFGREYNEKWDVLLEYNEDKKDDQFKPYGATPGHGMEWARLIIQWALSTYSDPEDQVKYTDAACSLYDRAVSDGWNADGAPGFVYTTDWEGAPVIHDRMHWTLAEAINTSSVLYRVTGNKKYAADFAAYTEYLDRYVLDHENGSWFHQLDRNNKVIGTVWPGKSDLYHALQAMLIPYGEVSGSVICSV